MKKMNGTQYKKLEQRRFGKWMERYDKKDLDVNNKIRKKVKLAKQTKCLKKYNYHGGVDSGVT